MALRTVPAENKKHSPGSSCRIGVAYSPVRVHAKDWFYSQVAVMTLVRTFVHSTIVFGGCLHHCHALHTFRCSKPSSTRLIRQLQRCRMPGGFSASWSVTQRAVRELLHGRMTTRTPANRRRRCATRG